MFIMNKKKNIQNKLNELLIIKNDLICFNTTTDADILQISSIEYAEKLLKKELEELSLYSPAWYCIKCCKIFNMIPLILKDARKFYTGKCIKRNKKKWGL